MLLSAPGNILKRIVLDRIKQTLDKNLRDEHAGFRGEICKNQESFEWRSFLHVKFLDFQKNIDSWHREVLWKVLIQNHFVIPTMLITLIKSIYYYTNMKCQVFQITCKWRIWNSPRTDKAGTPSSSYQRREIEINYYLPMAHKIVKRT